MTDITRYVEINITREDTPVTRESFGIPLVLGTHKVFNERAREYTSLQAMSTDGFLSTDLEYIAAEKTFSQNPRPEKLVIGRRNVDKITIEVKNELPNTDYYTKINDTQFDVNSNGTLSTSLTSTGTTATFNTAATPGVINGDTVIISGAAEAPYNGTFIVSNVQATSFDYTMSTTAPSPATGTPVFIKQYSVAAALVAAINGGSEPVTATDLLNGKYEINADVSGIAYTAFVDEDQEIEKPMLPTDTITNDITAVYNENKTWYGVDETLRDPTEVIELAAWIEANKKLMATSSSDTNIINQSSSIDTTSVPAVLKAGEYDRTYTLYHDDVDSFPDLAWMAKMFVTDPGSATWAFKTLTGIESTDLTDNQIDNALSKNCNVYIPAGGVNITDDGKVASGEYIDIIRGIDWFENRMKEDIFQLLINLPKIPYTNSGIAAVEAVIRAVIREGINSGFLTNDILPVITVPKVTNVDPNDKANRILRGITFKVVTAGAIHKVVINGIVSVF